MRLLSDHLAPRLIGKDAERIEAIWRELEFATHATTIGAISALALAAIDTALWDLSCKRRQLAAVDRRRRRQRSAPALYDRGRLAALARRSAGRGRAWRRRQQGFRGSKIKIGRPHVAEDHARLAAVRRALGDDFEIMTDANQGFSARRGDPPRRALRRSRSRLDRGAVAGGRSRRPCPAFTIDVDADRGRRVALFDPPLPRIYGQGRLLDRADRRRAHRRHHALAQGGACGGGVRHADVPAFPDGAARQPRLRRAERALRRIYPATRRTHVARHDVSKNGMAVAPSAPGIGIAWDWEAVKRRSVTEFTREIAN